MKGIKIESMFSAVLISVIEKLTLSKQTCNIIIVYFPFLPFLSKPNKAKEQSRKRKNYLLVN
jgi:hypothetical protein